MKPISLFVCFIGLLNVLIAADAITEESANVGYETLLDVDFNDFSTGEELSKYGLTPLNGPNFGHITRELSKPDDYYLAHRPGTPNETGRMDSNWHGAYFSEKLLALKEGEAMQVSFDFKLYARNSQAWLSMLDCMLESPGRKGLFSGAYSYFKERSLQLNQFGFRLMQSPPLKSGEFKDGCLSVVLKPWEYWVPNLCVDLNDLGISKLGEQGADTESDPLFIQYTLRRLESDGSYTCSLMIHNKTSDRSWRAEAELGTREISVDVGFLLGFATDDELSGGEGFEIDNLKCRIHYRNAPKQAGQSFEAVSAVTTKIDLGVGFRTPEVPRQDTKEKVDTALFGIPDELKRLREIEVEMSETLAGLPRVGKPLLVDAYGYHGDYLPVLDELPELPRWTVDVQYGVSAFPNQLVLVPAIDQRFGSVRSYGFPKRFRILQVYSDGSTNVACEWMDADCPDYGRVPLVIDLPSPRSALLRLEVFRGSEEGGKEFFALDELFAVVRQEVFRAKVITTQNSFDAPPYWGEGFLIDQKTSLGLPLDNANGNTLKESGNDYVYVFDKPLDGGGVVEIDLGKNQMLGWVDLFPASPPEGIFIPGYGFPGRIELEMIPETADGQRGQSVDLETTWEQGTPGNNIVRLEGRSRRGRWIRLLMSDFPTHRGKETFAMGEVSVYRNDENYSIQSVKFEGFPEEASHDAQLLVDGRANGRPIMRLLDWFRELEQRGHLSQQFLVTSKQRQLLEQRWSQFKGRSLIALVILVLVTAVGVAIAAIVYRKRNDNLLRQQITRDLHDEIGAKVGAIHLFSSLVRKTVSDPRALDSNRKIEVIAEEMQQSLRDVLWFTNSDTDTVREMVRKLEEIANSMVPRSLLVVTAPDLADVPEGAVSVQLKRNVMLIMREALHNATQHSEASRIEVRIVLAYPRLSVAVCDDGRGFDMSRVETKTMGERPHLGLDNMYRRAKNAKGELKVESKPEHGTIVSLTLKL